MSKSSNPHIDQLWASLQQQPRKLSSLDRRRVLVYLQELGELQDKSNYELGLAFQVDEKMIRKDKKKIVLSIGEEMTADNAMALVMQHTADIDGLLAKAFKTLHKVTLSDNFFLQRGYIETISKLLQQKFVTLQEIGIVRKELGHMAVTHEDWVATISDEQIASVEQATPERGPGA